METRKVFRTLCALVFASVAVLTSCDRNSPSEAPAFTPSPSAAVVPGSDGGSYKLIEGQIPSKTRTVSQWIGPLGGTLIMTGDILHGKVSAHILVVPPLAVLKSTLFTMSLPSDNYVSVDLKAEQKNLLGGMTDVGSKGFNLPVVLTLTYLYATNVTNPSHLKIVYVPKSGAVQPQPFQINLLGLNVTATLKHFSKYAMAED